MSRFALILTAVSLQFLAPFSSLVAGDFFEVQKVEFLPKAPKTGVGVFSQTPILDKEGKPTKEVKEDFIPCLQVRVITEDQVKSSMSMAKAYFYDQNGELIEKVEKPSPVHRGGRDLHSVPIFYPKGKPETIYFGLPKKVQGLPSGQWAAVVIFGDQQGVAGESFPSKGTVEKFEFPEKEFFLKRDQAGPRKVAMDPLIEYVVKTRVPEQPQITLFLRPPIGMTDSSQAEGVLALCLIADSVEEVRRRLQAADSGDEVGGILKFAKEHKLVILCWGSRAVRQPGSTWDEINKKTNEEMEKTFDELADKWDKGVTDLVRKYGLPEKDFLLRGSSDAGQYAGRLAIRKPDRFLAVHIHIPNGFDAPRLEGNRVLWMLTTGEKDYCYERSLRYLNAARDLGYPIIYKAIVGLGHSGNPQTDALGLEFFDWALKMKDDRDKYDDSLKDEAGRPIPEKMSQTKPWPEVFANPPYVGDVVNQEMFPGKDQEMVPAGFKVVLPTQKMAEIWNRK